MKRSCIVYFMLLLSLSLTPAGRAYSSEKTDNCKGQQPSSIDVNEFDTFDFFQGMIEEDAARDKTRIRNCYNGPNMDFSFASVAESNENQPLAKYDTVTDRSGQTYHISKTRLLDKRDIDIVCVDKTSYKGNDQYSIIVFFKESSWDKVYAATGSVIKKRVALLKSGKLLSAPVMYQALTKVAQIAMLDSAADANWYVQGLIPASYSEDGREKAFIKWLEKRVQNYPNDSESLDNLAGLYSKTKSDCDKSLAVYERVINLNPSANYFSYYFPFLYSCYQNSKDFERAIKFHKSLIGAQGVEPLTEVYLRIGLASAYESKQDRQMALQELLHALDATKAVPTSYPWLKDNPSMTAIEIKLQDQKAEMIKRLEAEIEKMKSQDH